MSLLNKVKKYSTLETDSDANNILFHTKIIDWSGFHIHKYVSVIDINSLIMFPV